MKRMTAMVRRWLLLPALVLIVSGYGLTTQTAAGQEGLGLSPAAIELPDGLRGADYFESVAIINGQPEDQVIVFAGEGDPAGWVTFHDINDRATPLQQVTVPAESRVWLLAKISVPEGTPDGAYGGSVSLTPGAAAPGVGSSIGLILQLSIDVEVVGTENVDVSVIDIAAEDVEVGQPLKIAARFSNNGNVEVVPQLDVVVEDLAGKEIDQFSVEQAPLPPGEGGERVSVWDTTDRAEGDYIAKVRVTIRETAIAERNAEFAILPFGSTRKGELHDLVLVSSADPGGLAQLEAEFVNTGKVETKALFDGEVWRDGSLVDTLQTPEVYVSPNESAIIQIFVRVPEKGEYKVSGLVNYEGKQTESREATFSVSTSSTPWLLIGGIAAAAVLVLAGGFGTFWMRRRNGKV